MKHPYADILIAIANNETVQISYDYGKTWPVTKVEHILSRIADDDRTVQFRIKPKTILINGHEVPEPLKVKPIYMTTVYLPIPHDPDFYDSYSYDDDSVFCKRMLNQGLFHSTKEAAIKHAEALISFTKVNKE